MKESFLFPWLKITALPSWLGVIAASAFAVMAVCWLSLVSAPSGASTALYLLGAAALVFGGVSGLAFWELYQRNQRRKASYMLDDSLPEKPGAEAAMPNDRKLLYTIIDNLPDHVFVVGRNGQTLLVNKANAQFSGTDSPRDLMGKTVFDIFPPEVAARYAVEEEHIMQTGEAAINRDEIRLDANGQVHWFLTTRVPLRNQQGEIIGLVGISREITERKKIEDELAQERNLLRTVMDHLPDYIYVKDTESRFVSMNQATAHSLGLQSADQAMGKTDFDMLPADLAQKYVEADRMVMESGEEMLNREEPTPTRWLLTSKMPLRDAQGKVTGVVGISHDITERKRVEEALERERTLLRTVIDNLPDLIYARDVEGRFVLVNQACVDFVDAHRPEDLLGKTDFEFYEFEKAQRYYDDEQALMHSGQRMLNQEERIVIEKSRKTMWISATKVPLVDSAGKVIGLVGISRDITERKQVEEALAQEHNLLRTVIDNLPDLVWMKDTESRFVLCNEASLRFVGVKSAEEIAGKTDFDFFPQEDAQQYFDAEQAMIHGEHDNLKTWEDLLVIRNLGVSRWLLTTRLRLRDKDGRVIGLIGISRDITAQKEAEEALRETHEELERERAQLKAILDSMGEGVIYDEYLTTRYTNRSLEELTGYRADEWRGYLENVRSADMSDEDYTLLGERVTALMRTEGIWRGELKLRRKDGSEFDAALTRTRVLTPDEQVIGAVTLIRDISQEKNLQTQKERFFTNAAHELRTPIANLKTRLYLLRRQPERMETHIDVLEQVTNRMHRLIEDMLDMSRFERGVVLLERQVISIQDMIESACEKYRLKADERGIEMRLEMPPNQLNGFVDVKRMTQVLVTIISHGLNRSKQGGLLRVVIEMERLHRYGTTRDYAALHIIDQGQFLSDETIERMFKPFLTTKPGHESGTVLGMTIAKEIIEWHGGEIMISSEETSTTVTVRLPLLDYQAES